MTEAERAEALRNRIAALNTQIEEARASVYAGPDADVLAGLEEHVQPLQRERRRARRELHAIVGAAAESAHSDGFDAVRAAGDYHDATYGPEEPEQTFPYFVADVLHAAHAEGMDADVVISRALRTMRGDAEDGKGFAPESAHDALRAAVVHLASVIDVYTAYDLGPAFSCKEADALTAVFSAAGCADAAQRFADAHALGDDEEDDLHRGNRAEIAARLGVALD